MSMPRADLLAIIGHGLDRVFNPKSIPMAMPLQFSARRGERVFIVTVQLSQYGELIATIPNRQRIAEGLVRHGLDKFAARLADAMLNHTQENAA